MRLAESERRVMDLLWEKGSMTAREAAILLAERHGWKKTTSYTMLSRCADKGYLRRTEPNFFCTPLLTKQELSQMETDALICADFDGSAVALLVSLIRREKLSCAEVEQLLASLRDSEGVQGPSFPDDSLPAVQKI